MRVIGGSGYKYVQAQIRESKIRHITAPAQTTVYEEDGNYTIFGRAVGVALKGGASKHDNPDHVVTVKDIFLFIHNHVKKQLLKVNANKEKRKEKETAEKRTKKVIVVKGKKDSNKEDAEVVDEDEDKEVNMSPCLIIPSNDKGLALLDNPIAYTVGPPAAPERPWIISQVYNEVQLEWYDPAFDGISPSKYRLYMKNVTKNFNKWNVVYHPGDIRINTFVMKNLPLGVACQFRVQAFNVGGWGKLSEESRFVIPGEDLEPVSDEIRWRRLREGGILAILDRLELVPFHNDDHRIGLRLLVGLGQNQGGFKNSKLALRVLELAIKVLKTFDCDPKCIQYSFILLGWCLRSGKIVRKIRARLMQPDLALPDLVASFGQKFRTESSVIGGIQFLMGGMPGYLPNLPEMIHKTLNVSPEEENDESESESDEDRGGEEEEDEEENK